MLQPYLVYLHLISLVAGFPTAEHRVQDLPGLQPDQSPQLPAPAACATKEMSMQADETGMHHLFRCRTKEMSMQAD